MLMRMRVMRKHEVVLLDSDSSLLEQVAEGQLLRGHNLTGVVVVEVVGGWLDAADFEILWGVFQWVPDHAKRLKRLQLG